MNDGLSLCASTEHDWEADRVQVPVLGVKVMPGEENVTVPVGDQPPVKVAVQVVFCVGMTDEGEQETVVTGLPQSTKYNSGRLVLGALLESPL